MFDIATRLQRDAQSNVGVTPTRARECLRACVRVFVLRAHLDTVGERDCPGSGI